MEFRDAYDLLCAGNGIHDASFVDKYYEILKYILEGHENEGKEFFVPYEDRIASVSSKDGNRVYARRSPNMDPLVGPLKEADFENILSSTVVEVVFAS